MVAQLTWLELAGVIDERFVIAMPVVIAALRLPLAFPVHRASVRKSAPRQCHRNRVEGSDVAPCYWVAGNCVLPELTWALRQARCSMESPDVPGLGPQWMVPAFSQLRARHRPWPAGGRKCKVTGRVA